VVRRLLAEGMRLVVRVVLVPGILTQRFLVVSKREPRRGPRPAGILPRHERSSRNRLIDSSRSRMEAGQEGGEILALSLPGARQLPDEVLEALRLRAVRGIELGFTEVDVAEMLGVSQETVRRWWTAYAPGGLDAIPRDRTGRPVGSGRTLSDEPARRIQD